MKWYKKITLVFLLFLIFINFNYAEDSISSNVEESFGLDSYIDEISGFIEDRGIDNIDLSTIAKELVSGNGINYKSLFSKILSIFANEILATIKSVVSIFLIIVIMSLLSSLDIDEKGDITKLAKLACFIAIVTITVLNFIDIMSMFKSFVSTVTTIMQVVSPFLMAILIASGAITTTGIIQPLLLFISSLIGFLVNYVVFPFFTISLAFNIISRISDSIRFDKISSMFSNSAIWLVLVLLTAFLGILSLEGSISSSVDALTVKTTQTAFSNFIPVVGKFFSDSFETVVGATKIIGKVGGALGIIAVLVIAISPVIKILSVAVTYQILIAIAEPICNDNIISKYLGGLASVYKNLLGILIGIVILFIISTGIALNIVTAIIK